jgi:hypothetical protein
LSNIQYKCRSMGECNSYTLNCDYSLCTPTKQIFSSYFECVDIALPSSKNALPCYENELIGNIWIYNSMLHYLYPLKEIFTMRTTKKTIPTLKWQIPHWKGYGMGSTFIYHNKNHCVPCNMWNFMQYEKACSLTLNYYTLIVWATMVFLVHKESKSTNEFTRFCSELSEF